MINMIKRNEAKILVPIISAYAEGRILQYKDEEGWRDIEDSEGLSINTIIKEAKNYRIKPKSKYRPFKDAKECWNEMGRHHPFGWLKNGNCYYNVVSISNMDANIISLSDVVATLCFSDFIKKNYIFADGVSFGVKEEE